MDDLLDAKLDKKFNDNQKQSCIYICNKLTEWFGKNAVNVNINQWVADYSQGYDTARDDIKEFCKNKNSEYIKKPRTEWNSGYISALFDVIEYIERM